MLKPKTHLNGFSKIVTLIEGSAFEIQITIIRYGWPQRARTLASGIDPCIVLLRMFVFALVSRTAIWPGWRRPRSIDSNSKTDNTLRMCFSLMPIHSKEVSPASTV